jgi:hypothetical protein
MISTYRLGDLVLLSLNNNEIDNLLREHPNSIGSKYILELEKNNNADKIDIITKVVLEHIEQNVEILPNDISESTLIHLRLGDVVAGNTWHEIEKRPIEINDIKTKLANDNNKKYVIGKCFFAVTSSRNFNECIELSNKYLQNVLNEIGATHYDSGNADLDLCCAVKSKIFFQGTGHFSKLIVEIRKKLNLNNIEIEK